MTIFAAKLPFFIGCDKQLSKKEFLFGKMLSALSKLDPDMLSALSKNELIMLF